MKKYWKLFIAVLIIVSFGYNANAQADSSKAGQLKAKLVDSICGCVSKTDPNTIKTADDAQGLIMKCFMGDEMGMFMDYLTASGIDMTNIQQIQETAQKIGLQLSMQCPSLYKMMMNVAKDSTQMNKLMQEYNSAGGTPADSSKNNKAQ